MVELPQPSQRPYQGVPQDHQQSPEPNREHHGRLCGGPDPPSVTLPVGWILGKGPGIPGETKYRSGEILTKLLHILYTCSNFFLCASFLPLCSRVVKNAIA